MSQVMCREAVVAGFLRKLPNICEEVALLSILSDSIQIQVCDFPKIRRYLRHFPCNILRFLVVEVSRLSRWWWFCFIPADLRKC
jgi:hypothetical protein